MLAGAGNINFSETWEQIKMVIKGASDFLGPFGPILLIVFIVIAVIEIFIGTRRRSDD